MKISEEAYTQELARVEGIFDQLDEKIVELIILEDESSEDEELQEFYGKELELMENLKEKLDARIRQHTIYSFNGECSLA